MKQLKFIRFSFIFIMTTFVYQQQFHAQVNLNAGLIAQLPMDGSGIDISGNNNNATIVGPYVFPGADRFLNFHGSMRFMGSASQAKMTFGTPLLSNRAEFTISYWFLLSEALNGMNILGQDNLLETAYYTSPNEIRVYHPTSGSIGVPLSSPFYNNWRHLVVTGNSSEINIYLNGVLVHTQSGDFSLGSNTNFTNIGGHVVSQTSTNWMRGNVDNIFIYDRVITTDEVNALYTNNFPELTITNVSNTTFCAGDIVVVDFTATGEISTGNEYLLQMSNASGNFSNPIIVDRLMSSNLSETFNSTIPSGTPSGASYRFRVTSTLMAAVSDTSSDCAVSGILGDIPDPAQFQYIGEVNGKNYYKSTGTSPWVTANNNCISNGGHLATVSDSATNSLLHYNARDGRLYLGFRDFGSGFEWVNEMPVVYTNWAAGQPTTQDFAEMRDYDASWIATTNTNSKKYILELNPEGLNASFCTGDDITLEAATLTGATYDWTGPNGFTSSDQITTITGATSVNEGTYSLVYTIGGCSSSPSTVEVDMNELPGNSLISVWTDSICPGSNAQIIVENSEIGLTYQLQDALTSMPIGSPQNGTGDTLFFATGILGANTDFNFSVDITSTGCNTVTADLTVTVLSPPNPPTTIGDSICNAGQLTLEADGAETGGFYNWYTQPSGGSPLTGLTGSTHMIDTNVIANFYVSITDSNGCESSRTQVTGVVFNPLQPPVDLITGLILHYPMDGNLEDLSGYGYDATINGTNSFVNDRLGNPSSALNTTSGVIPGNNYFTAGNPQKIQELSTQVSISFWMRQTQSWFGDDFIIGHTPLINKWNGSNGLYLGLENYNPGNPQNRIRWRVNGSNSVISNANVTLLQWNHVVCTYNGTQLRIYINGVFAGSAASAGIGATGAQLQFGRQANGSGEITYRGNWDQIRIYNRALNVSEIQTLYNNESVAFVNDPFCDEEEDLALTTFEFPGATYLWTGPNGFTSTDQNPSIISNADSTTYAGTYTLIVTDTNGCVSPPQTAEAIIYAIPVNPITTNDTVCGSGNAILTASGAPVDGSYNWYVNAVGGSPISGQSGPILTITNLSATTTRYVSIIRNGCESDRVPVTAVYNNLAATDLAITGSNVCANELNTTVTIVLSENNVYYQAFIGAVAVTDSVVGNGGDLLLTINTGALNIGNNTLSIQANYPGCSPVELDNTVLVTVNALPNVDAGTAQSICMGDEVTLNGAGAQSYVWNNGVTNGVAFTPSTTDTYTVTGTDANGCENTDQVVVTVNTIPTVDAGLNQTICTGESVILSGSGADSYSWNFGVVNGVAFIPSGTETYTVTGFTGGCQATDEVTVTLNALPTIGATSTESEICAGESVTLNGTGGTNYNWDNGVTNGVLFSPSTTETYTVTGTDANGCENTALIQVVVNQLPNVDAGTAQSICMGDDVTLNGAGAESYVWNNGVTNGMAFTPSATDTYTVTGTDANGCQNTDQVVVTVNALPNVAVTQNGLTVTAVESNATYQWIDCISETDIFGETNQSYTATANGEYAVVLESTDGCVDTSSCIVINTIGLENISVADYVKLYPNPATNIITLEISDVGIEELHVFDGAGKLLLAHSLDDIHTTINVERLEPGMYFYRLISKQGAIVHSDKFNIIR